MAIKITLDPGHGQFGNPYPPRKGYYEGTQMWKLANFLMAELKKFGFEVVTTRPKITDNPSLEARGQMAGKNGSSLFLSLHSNSPAKASDTKPTGSVVYYSMTDPKNKEFADQLGKKVSEVMGHYYRGSLTRQYPNKPGVDYYGVLRASAQSGCKKALLIEHGFHTNLKDSAFLVDDANLKKLAAAEAEIIAEHFGQKKIASPKPLASGILYRVQTGAFSKKANAEALLKKVKAAGFDTYMVFNNGLYKVQVGAFSKKSNADAMASKLKAKGFDVYITTEAGQAVTPAPTATPKKVQVKCKVKVKKGAKSYEGKSIASWVYNNVYTVDELKGDRAVLDKKGICTAFKVSDLIVQ